MAFGRRRKAAPPRSWHTLSGIVHVLGKRGSAPAYARWDGAPTAAEKRRRRRANAIAKQSRKRNRSTR